MASASSRTQPLSLKKIAITWWPLAASWMLMGAELPLLSAVVARLADPEINLAAYGGVVFPLALIIESPVIMLLAASTALSRDWDAYCKLRRFMMAAGAALTALHILVAFTPLYYVVVEGLLGAPQEIVAPARIGLMIMTPWTWSIAYRRFNQGVLIRFGHSRAVGAGTVIRLIADVLVLALGYMLGGWGIVVGTSAVAAGVVSEAIYVGLRVQPVLNNELKPAPPAREKVGLRSFLDFYIPLAMTSLLTLLVNPLGSAALSRMPDALPSLAVWPVVSGLIFILRGLGMAFNEVTVALLDEPRSAGSLRRFAYLLAGSTSAALLVLAATPLSRIWFQDVSALSPRLAEMAGLAIWLGLPLPFLTVMQSWYQGAILHGRRTRGVTEAVGVFLVANALALWAGVLWSDIPGLYVGMASFSLAAFVQTVWLAYRSKPALEKIATRDDEQPGRQAGEAPAG